MNDGNTISTAAVIIDKGASVRDFDIDGLSFTTFKHILFVGKSFAMFVYGYQLLKDKALETIRFLGGSSNNVEPASEFADDFPKGITFCDYYFAILSVFPVCWACAG